MEALKSNDVKLNCFYWTTTDRGIKDNGFCQPKEKMILQERCQVINIQNDIITVKTVNPLKKELTITVTEVYR
jgi:hypothetical protein